MSPWLIVGVHKVAVEAGAAKSGSGKPRHIAEELSLGNEQKTYQKNDNADEFGRMELFFQDQYAS